MISVLFKASPTYIQTDMRLCYMGDIEISGEASLADLKIQVSGHPLYVTVLLFFLEVSHINTYFYFLFPCLQYVLIWHLLICHVQW